MLDVLHKQTCLDDLKVVSKQCSLITLRYQNYGPLLLLLVGVSVGCAMYPIGTFGICGEHFTGHVFL